MKELLLKTLISMLLGMLTEKNMRAFIDWILDFAEDAAMNSENKYDDVVILGLCGKIRTVFGVPDNDPVKVVAVLNVPTIEAAVIEEEEPDVAGDSDGYKEPSEPHVFQDEDPSKIDIG